MKGTQRRTIRKEKNNSAGFTLIEMIVTVAIIAIFSGVVVTLITTGSSLFRGVSGNTKSQVKAQETLDEIEDLIIDANRSIYYAYGSGTDMGTQITSDIDDSNAASKTFIACNEYENGDGTSRYVFDVLDWVGSEGKLYYSQREYTKASSNTEEENENGTGDNSENQPFSHRIIKSLKSRFFHAPPSISYKKTRHFHDFYDEHSPYASCDTSKFGYFSNF